MCAHFSFRKVDI